MGEINAYDKFGSAIIQIVKQYNIQKVLEIGSWDGTGSTQCFIEGMKNFKDPQLTCIEIQKDRYLQLVKNTQHYPWIKCVNQSTISLKSLVNKDFESIWSSPFNHIKSDKNTVKNWFDSDINEISKYEVGFLEEDQSYYDGILIDGGEFFGYSEFLLVKDRCKVLFLDDYYSAFKTRQAVTELNADKNWQCIAGDMNTRNGFAVFIKK